MTKKPIQDLNGLSALEFQPKRFAALWKKKNINYNFALLLILTLLPDVAHGQIETTTVSEESEINNELTPEAGTPDPETQRKVVRFQIGDRATTNSYMQWEGDVPTMFELTMCLRARLEHLSLAQSTFVSYFPDGENQLTLFYDWEANELVLGAYSNSLRATIRNASLPLYTWFTFCIGINFNTDSYAAVLGPVYSSGELPEEDEISDRYIPGGGTLVIAQEQDKFGGLFSIGQMFSGDMAEFRLFSRVLTEKEMQRYVSCGYTSSDGLVSSFDSLEDNWLVFGDTEITVVEKYVLCEKKRKEFFVFPEKRIFQEAQKMCEKLSLPMALPESEEENQKLFELGVAVESLCLSSYSTNVWIGAQGDVQKDEWQNLINGQALTYDNLDKRYTYINEESRCISQGGSFYPAIWYTTFCSRYKPCAACEDAPASSIRIRGLCRDSRLDRELYVHGLRDQKPMLQGLFYSNVFWNNFTWIMTSRNYPDIRAEMRIAFIDDYPIGLQQWHIEGDVCPDKDMPLMMTVCGEGSFTCNDGTCVKISQRCDLKVNCDDKSDEVDCARAQVGLDYASHIPPPPPKNVDTINVTMDIIITSVRNLNLLDQKISLDVTLVLQWEDSRLKYYNLQEQMNRNLIDDKDKIWTPRLVITDDTGSQVDFLERRAALVVIKESEPLPDDDTNVKEAAVYLGEGNRLSLRQEATISYQCQFDLRKFPFDEQFCSLSLELSEVESLLVKLRRGKDGVVYKGSKQLPEYSVSRVSMKVIATEESSGQQITMKLDNLYRYYLGNAYVPSFLLVVICYSTFFFRLEEFGDRIMVSITAMLVLVALFSQTSETIPRTTYLKYIDVWYMFYIVLDFIMIILLVLINYVGRVKGLKDAVSMVKPLSSDFANGQSFLPEKNLKKTRNVEETLNLWARIGVPIIDLVFTVCYAAITLS